MATPFVQIDLKEVSELLQKLKSRTTDLSPTMLSISNILHSAVMDNFNAQGNRPNHWQALAESTKTARSKKNTWPGQILAVSAGGLKSSITQAHSPFEASVGTNKEYAAIHQFGGKAGRGLKATIPARPFLSITQAEINEIATLISNELEKNL